MPKFRKKPIVIEAMVFSIYNIEELKEFVGEDLIWGSEPKQALTSAMKECYLIRTLEGDIRVRNGDYIIKGIKGEFYPCDPEIFEESYERVEDELVSDS